jgi:hypothetical protein
MNKSLNMKHINANNELTAEFKRLTAAIPIASSQSSGSRQVDRQCLQTIEPRCCLRFLKYPVVSRCADKGLRRMRVNFKDVLLALPYAERGVAAV